MFDNIKQLNELRKMRSEALKLQHQLAQELVEIEKEGIKIVVSGDQKIRTIIIDGQERKDLVDLINHALKEAQTKAVMKLSQSGGGGLTSLLSGL